MIAQMNRPYSISNFFTLLFKTSLLPQNFSCSYQRVELYFTVEVMFFNQIAAILKKTAAIETTVVPDCMMVI